MTVNQLIINLLIGLEMSPRVYQYQHRKMASDESMTPETSVETFGHDFDEGLRAGYGVDDVVSKKVNIQIIVREFKKRFPDGEIEVRRDAKTEDGVPLSDYVAVYVDKVFKTNECLGYYYTEDGKSIPYSWKLTELLKDWNSVFGEAMPLTAEKMMEYYKFDLSSLSPKNKQSYTEEIQTYYELTMIMCGYSVSKIGGDYSSPERRKLKMLALRHAIAKIKDNK